jgi:hypothetical protein
MWAVAPCFPTRHPGAPSKDKSNVANADHFLLKGAEAAAACARTLENIDAARELAA